MLVTLLAIYLIGVGVYACLCFHKWYYFTEAQNAIDIDDEERASWKRIADYQSKKTLFWPYYLFFKTNPIVLLSTTVFARYGSPDTRYFGTQGLQNFLNDLLKGTKRYKECQIHKVFVELDKKTPYYRQLAPLLQRLKYCQYRAGQ